MRAPAFGVIPPNAAARINYNPELASDELPILLGLAGKTTISIETSPGAVILTNLTASAAPFMLVIVPQNPKIGVTLASIFEALRERIGG
jgi:hypothetical protein